MNTGNGNGAYLVSFGETLSITDIKIGPDASNFGVISYDPFDAQFTFGPSNATTPVVIGADGKVGIGVDPANGFLDVRGGDGTTPSVIIEPGLLAAAPPNGALEFDGSNIYFTKGGVRSPLGERGPAGIPGPTGATGPVGPVGPSGSTSLANTTLVNGDMIFVNGALLENATLNGSITITPGSVVSVNGVTFEGPHITFNGTVFSDRFNATLFNGTTFNGITANFTNLNATNFIATNLSGNGAGLTNVDARTLNGLDFTSFLRSNLSDTFNGVELDFSAASKLDLNGDLEIADTMIEFDGGDTTFNGSGAFSIKPALDQNVSINTAANGDFIVKNNLIFAEGHNGNVGIGLTEPPEKLTVNGILALREGVSIPPGSAGYGKLYVKTADAKLYFHSSDGNDYDLTAAASGGGDAGTLDGIDSAEFLRSNTNTTYSSGTFTINSGTTFDVNSGNVSIRDNSINFDTATSTTFNGSGAFTIRPMSGSNLNVNLANTGDFKINTNDLVVDTSAGFIGLGTAAPQQPLHIDAAGLGSSNASVLMTAKEGSNWIYGVDNGDSAKFKLANGNDLTTNVVFTALKSGNIGIGYINPQAKLHVNGQILATVFNGTFIGDGSGLTGVASSNGSVTNVTINNGSTYNSTFSNSYFNGDTVFNAGDTFFNNGITAFNNGDIFFNNGTKLFFNGGTMEGNVTINGAVHADEYHARLFNGDVFNGGIFRGTFVGDASGLTGVVSSTGNATTLDNLDSSAFLRSNTTTAFTLGTLNLGTSTTLDVNGTAQFDGTTFDVNSTTVSIADTNITLDGAFTKFTQSFGAIQMIPGSGATFTVNGAMTFVPSTTVSVAAGVSIPVTNSIVKIVGNSGPVNLSNGHQLTTGADGQIIILRGTNNTNTVTLEEANGLALTDGLSFILGNKDTMSLMYDASDDQWIEISRSDK
jgi:hypothetical protein